MFSICCFIVLLSVVLHGGSLMFLKRDGSTAEPPQPPARNVVIDSSSTATFSVSENKPGELITIGEMKKIQQSGEPYLVLDVRADGSFADSDLLAEGALRIPPDRAVERLKELDMPRQTLLFVFCA